MASDTRSRFESIYREFSGPVFAYCMRRAKPEDAVPRLFGEVDGAGFTVTDQSVPLWGQRTREYVTEVTGP